MPFFAFILFYFNVYLLKYILNLTLFSLYIILAFQMLTAYFLFLNVIQTNQLNKICLYNQLI